MAQNGWLIAATLVALVCAIPMRASAEEPCARAALAAALSRADAEARAAPRMAFTETVAEKGVVVSGRFNPAEPAGARWTPVGLVAASGQQQESYRGIVNDTPDERDLLLTRVRSTVAGPGDLVSEENGVAMFDFPMSPSAHPTNSPLDGALNLSSHIRVQLSVNEATQTLTGMRFYAPAAFAATPLARVDRIDLRFEFGDSFPGGPTIVRRVDTDAAYQIAGFSNTMRDTVWFGDVAPMSTVR